MRTAIFGGALIIARAIRRGVITGEDWLTHVCLFIIIIGFAYFDLKDARGK